MIHSYSGNSAVIYRQQLGDLVHAPEVVLGDGRRTNELLNVIIDIEFPRGRMSTVPGRTFNPWLALSESLWILAGRDDIECLLPYNRCIREFSDDGKTLHGAYGKRIHDQIEPLLDRLRADPTDRRAVLSIWRSSDLWKITKDPPCNDMVMFKLREDKLQMAVFCRSNDLHWGLHAVNIFTFGILQEYLAARLGAGLGRQLHFSQSLHIYLDGPGAAITGRMLVASGKPIQECYGAELFPSIELARCSPAEMLVDMHLVLNRQHIVSRLSWLEFAEDFLRWYRERPSNKKLRDSCRHAEKFTDWIAAGEVFMEEKER